MSRTKSTRCEQVKASVEPELKAELERMAASEFRALDNLVYTILYRHVYGHGSKGLNDTASNKNSTGTN